MLRCTVAGLIPLMNSRKYGAQAETLFARSRGNFEAIIRNRSYYILRTLPAGVARTLLLPVVAQLAAGQMKNGLWRGKNGKKTTYDILSALDHAGLRQEAALKVSPVQSLRDAHDEYALLIKQQCGVPFTAEDSAALLALTRSIADAQGADGSFGDTVTGTVIALDRLLDLGMAADDPVMRRGVDYLLSQRKETLQGMHTSEQYSLAASNIFTTDNRNAEFQAADTQKPEWLPRQVCFHTMAIIPNAVCLRLLLRLGLEDDPGVSAALTSLYELYNRHGGLCATNIKKPYL